MLATLAGAGVVLVVSAVCGAALWRACGLTAPAGAAPPLGLAALLVVGGITGPLPGGAFTTAVVLLLAILAALAGLLARPPGPRPSLVGGLTAVAALALALLPFWVSGHFGVLGAGTDDDLTEHLLAAWTLAGHGGLHLSKLIDSGYPIGIHAVAAALSEVPGISLEAAFTGVIVAIPVVLALTALPLLGRGLPPLRGLCALAVGLCYLQSAYLVQASFKEPLQATLLVAALAVAVELRARPQAARAALVPLAVLAAGTVYVYSYTAFLWPAGVAGLLLASHLLARARGRAGNLRAAAGPFRRAQVLMAGGVFLVLVAPEIPRTVRFLGSGYNQETGKVLGNLLHPLSPLEAVGVWPRLDFRFSLPLGSLGGVLALLTALVLLACVVASLRRGEGLLVATLASAAAIWAVSALRSPYTAAKALVIVAPLATLLLARELLGQLPRARKVPLRGAAAALLAVCLGAGLYSDLALLRDGPVGPTARAGELERLRAMIGTQPTLFLGADDFVLWELRGATVATPPAPLYAHTVVPLRREKAQQARSNYTSRRQSTTRSRFAGLGLAFDFDSVPAPVLDRFTYIILPRSGYASAPPPNWQPAWRGRSYELWRRSGATEPRRTLLEIDNPGAILDCGTRAGRALAARAGVALVRPAPVVGERAAWHGAVGEAGLAAHQYLHLGPGPWELSLQYASVGPLTLRAAGRAFQLPASLEPLGPYWLAGRLQLRHGGWIRVSVTWPRVGAFGRLLGASGMTRAPLPTKLEPLHRVVAARPLSRQRLVPLGHACGRYVDWYRLGGSR